MLVTVVRSYSASPVELPDGNVLRPWRWVEYKDVASMKEGLEKLVSAGLVKIAQIQDLGPLMMDGTAENRLDPGVIGTSNPNPTYMATGEQLKKFEEVQASKDDNISESSKPSVLSSEEAEATAEFRPDTNDLMVSKVSVNQLARGVVPPEDLDDPKSLVKVAAGVPTDASDAKVRTVVTTPGGDVKTVEG